MKARDLKSGNKLIIGQEKTYILNKNISGNNQEIIIKGTLKVEKGGSLSNVTIIGKGGRIIAPAVHCFTNNVKIIGDWKNTTTHLEWLTNDFSDKQQNNLSILYQLIRLNCPIELSNQYTLSGLNKREKAYKITNSVRLSGNTKKAGFVLKGSTNTKRLFYLRGQTDIDFKNLSFTTVDFKENSKKNTSTFTDYSYNKQRHNFIFHNIDEVDSWDKTNVSLKKCKFYGNISFTYTGFVVPYEINQFLIDEIGFDRIEVSGCYLEEVNELLSVYTLPYKQLTIQNNIINNINGPTFFFPLNAKYSKYQKEVGSRAVIGKSEFIERVELLHLSRKYALVDNNQVKNDKIFLKPYHYVSLISAKGGKFTVTNNNVENILTKDGENTENFSVFCSARDSLIFMNNNISNCINYSNHINNVTVGRVSLLKLKKTKKCLVKGNTFSVEREALERIEVINKNADLNKIDSKKFRLALLDVSVQTDNNSNYLIIDNTFKTAYLNEYSTIRKKSFKFVDNTIEVDYMAKVPANKWSDANVIRFSNPTLFYIRHERKKEQLFFEGNEVDIKEVEGENVDIFSYTEGSVYDYKNVRVENNTVKLNKRLNEKSIPLPPQGKNSNRKN